MYTIMLIRNLGLIFCNLQLSSVLDIDAQLIKNAVSVYCRLGFAYKKNVDIEHGSVDPSWKKYQAKR